MVNRWGKVEMMTDFIFLSSKITSDNDCSHEIKRRLLLARKSRTNLENILKSRYIALPTKISIVKAIVFPVVMYICEGWTIKKFECWRCFPTVVLEETLESPLDCKEIQPVHPKGNQSWIFIGRTDAEAETPILWPLDVKNWLIGKDLDAGKDWRQEEKGMTENEMVGWHHWFNEHEFAQAPGGGDRHGSLACYSPWGHKESDMTEQLNWTGGVGAGGGSGGPYTRILRELSGPIHNVNTNETNMSHIHKAQLSVWFITDWPGL